MSKGSAGGPRAGSSSGVAVYSDQVAGHGTMLRAADRVYKPLQRCEYEFYQKLIQDGRLVPHIARVYGAVELDADIAKSGSFPDRASVASSLKSAQDTSVRSYIALENLTHGFAKACALDLKIGTRQHGRGVSEKKRASAMAKCASTTSRTMGMRLCGMRVLRATEPATWLSLGKMDGRALTDTDLRETLWEFFHDGTRVHTALLRLVVDQVAAVLQAVRSMDGFRFYSSSLLIVYDPTAATTRWAVRMIDFAHAFHDADEDGADKGHVFGLSTLHAELSKLLDRKLEKSESSYALGKRTVIPAEAGASSGSRASRSSSRSSSTRSPSS